MTVDLPNLRILLVLTCLAWLTCNATTTLAQTTQGDYLPADLRSRVAQLKADRNVIATSQTNAGTRARLMWEWLNAYALNGGYVPVNATQVIAAVLGRPDNPVWLTALDDVIAEFVFLDDNPRGLGQLDADLGPFTAAMYVTIKQTYTVGAKQIQTGGGFLTARHFMTNFGHWQAENPSADHYITIASSNPKVTFVTSTKPLGGMHGGFRNSRPTLAFEVASGTLVEGDKVTITYGDTRQGSKGILTPTFSSDRMPLPLYVSFAEKGQFFSLPIQPIKIIGTELAGVSAFLPSVVKPGETFELAVRGQDRYYNRATGDMPNWVVLLNNKPWQTVAGQQAISVQNATIAAPGTYFVTVASADGSITGTGNPILVTAEQRNRIYWGDTHGHSGFAEGIGTPTRFMQWAKQDARLDYVTHSEHDIWLDDAEWEVLRQNVQEFSEEGKFIAYLGYEWTVANIRGGHHNVLFRRPEEQNRVPSQFYPTLSTLYQGLRTHAKPADVVVIPHAHQAGDYRLNDPALEPLVEIMSQHGNFEWFGRLYLQHGHQVGFTAASDNHLSQPGFSAPQGGSLSQRGGLGAILASERTTDGIFDAMKNLQAYATTGDRIILDFDVNGTPMGKRGKFSPTRKVSGRVIGTAPIDTITVVKNEKEIWQQSYLTPETAKMGKTETFLLTFASDSQPFHRGDNPRGWRAWEGTLEVINADLQKIEAYDASFPLQTVTPSQANSNVVTFATKTRGDTSSYLVTLNNIQRSAKVQFDIVENRETGGAPPVFRPPQRVAALSFALALRDMQANKVEHRQSVDGYSDSAVLRRIITNGPKEVVFEFEDSGESQGDYYFVRVVQANDAIAWSSPVWLGGFPKQ